ncbi:GNAT family N-acetyltransferase [Pseudoflavonifractor sp. 524-17]|uniref:GNAT family N-acetyltransferase n=1 Tax=Pseudoflavonifractor sp. 524-17 TaxID=2304577 RepID=UPI001379ABB6|nr:GNAT family N-acetyltransferase [Pseudoflavonifractor sp. 524-17]NCE66182.1 GNAT family N-acetyltransferase [Pseudoflavonifractor sp. 524-17]
MTQTELRGLVRDQLALDLGCDPALLDTPDNAVVQWMERPRRRRYNDSTPMLELAVWNGKLIAAAQPALLPWAERYFADRPAQWLFHPARYREIDAALAPLGYEIGDAHKFYLPDLSVPETAPSRPVRWYEEGELEPFRGQPFWGDALCFNPLFPDRLAVAALDPAGRPTAMAGASQDGARMWQIGINVLPEHRGKGLAVYLTALLKDELLRRDLVPFYGTGESHIISQNVAKRAGFLPGFAYLYAKPKGTEDHG